jgi:hypothetical protein
MGCMTSQDDANETNQGNTSQSGYRSRHERSDSEIEEQRAKNEQMANNGGADALMII